MMNLSGQIEDIGVIMVCTIGNLFHDGLSYTFKQCDLVEKTEFIEPSVVNGESGIRYLPFRREGRSGDTPCWAGINNYGVAFVAADAYTNREYQITDEWKQQIFSEYEKIISSYRTAKDAAKAMTNFYMTGFPAPDIVHITDANIAIFIEYTPAGPELIGSWERTDGFFASTNHFRMLPDAIEYDKDHSTYLRLERAEAILQSKPEIEGIAAALRDQYYGQTSLSICRVADNPPQYHTQANVVFMTDGKRVDCGYILNGSPRENLYEIRPDVFDTSIVIKGEKSFDKEDTPLVALSTNL